jgi:ABC-type phosphate/phosphonate transport system ATPase subunit
MAKSKKLPKKLIHLKNADKHFHEKWTQKRDPLNIPHPYRACIIGKPNSGKTSVIKNILVRADPPFETVTVVHCDEFTEEYADVGATVLTQVPSLDHFDRELKNLLIIDDISFKNLDPEEKKLLDRCFGYISTHKNVSIMLTSQVFHSIPINIRLCANMFIMWKSNDMRQMSEVADKVGMVKKDLLVKLHALKGRESLWIDGTDYSPYPLRVDGYTIL